MPDYCCAIDLGTSGAKLALVDTHGHIVDSRTVTYALQSPRIGWAEVDPHKWIEAIEVGLAKLLAQSSGRVVAVGLDGQMHGLVMGCGEAPLRPAMLWPDSRALDQLSDWRALPARMRAALANPLAPGMFGPMLGWIAHHEPEVLAQAEYACSPKDWVRHRLATGGIVTDASDASATLTWDIPGHRWHTELLEALELPTHLLPNVVSSADHVTVRGGGSLPSGVPMSVGCADTAAALLAIQLQPGEVLVNLGTGIQVCMGDAVPEATTKPTCHTFADAVGGWYSMVAPQNGGMALGQVRTLLNADWSELYDSLESRPDDTSSVRFLPWFAPDRLPRLRPGDLAGWQGMGLSTTRSELLRAALESIAFQVKQAISALPTNPAAMRFTGGGTRDPRMCQLICDVVGLPGQRSTVMDATALGAAFLGFVAAGHDPEWLIPREENMIEPQQDPALNDRCQWFSSSVQAQEPDLETA